MRKMPFFKKDYYKADLNRICDAEEIVSEWYPMNKIVNGTICLRLIFMINRQETRCSPSMDLSIYSNIIRTGNLLPTNLPKKILQGIILFLRMSLLGELISGCLSWSWGHRLVRINTISCWTLGSRLVYSAKMR